MIGATTRRGKKIAGRHRSAVDSLVGRRRGIRIRSQVDTTSPAYLHDALHRRQLLDTATTCDRSNREFRRTAVRLIVRHILRGFIPPRFG